MNFTADENARHILLADTELKFLEEAQKDPRAELVPVVVARDLKTVQEVLANLSLQLIALVLHPSIDKPNAISVIRSSRIYRPALPIYILYDEDPPYNEQEKKDLTIQDFLRKPMSYSQIADTLGPLLIEPDVPPADQPSALATAQLNEEVSAADAAFVPIRAQDFMAGSKSSFDIFIRLSTGRYVKIALKGEACDPKRISNFVQKGVREFYLEKSAQAKYVTYCDQIAEKVATNSQFGANIQIKGMLTHGQETVGFLKSQGLNSGTISFAVDFVSNVEKFAKTTKLYEDKNALKYLEDFTKYDHGVSISLISSLIGKVLKFDGTKAVKLLGLASLFHDIGLVGMPPEFQEEDETKMDEKQLEEYQKHCLIGSQMLSALGVDTVVVQAVLQHHERRTRKGFPAQLGVGAINRIAEIIGISDEFNKMVKLKKAKPELDVFGHMRDHIFQGFSFNVTEAFREVFFPNEQI